MIKKNNRPQPVPQIVGRIAKLLHNIVASQDDPQADRYLVPKNTIQYDLDDPLKYTAVVKTTCHYIPDHPKSHIVHYCFSFDEKSNKIENLTYA